MSIEDNTVVGRWFTECDDVRRFATDFREAFPDLGFEGTADLIAEEIGLDDGVTVLKQLGLIPQG
jgi:hypothetical protein